MRYVELIKTLGCLTISTKHKAHTLTEIRKMKEKLSRIDQSIVAQTNEDMFTG